MTYAVKTTELAKSTIPAVVHVDGTSRVQTVNRNEHRGLWRVLNKFYLNNDIYYLHLCLNNYDFIFSFLL